MRYLRLLLIASFAFFSFNFADKNYRINIEWNKAITIIQSNITSKTIAEVAAEDLIEFAKSFLGTPYVWGSVNPKVGFDCSGFVNHVSKHFGFAVPRSSVQFTNLGSTVETRVAQPGDIILFTGTNPKKRVVGHMGIITENRNGVLQFIHSSSGLGKGVNISGLTGYYKERLVKIIRLFPLAATSSQV